MTSRNVVALRRFVARVTRGEAVALWFSALLGGGVILACGTSPTGPVSMTMESAGTESSSSPSNTESGGTEPSTVSPVDPALAALVPAGCEVVEFESSALELAVRGRLAGTSGDMSYLTRTSPLTGIEVVGITGLSDPTEDVTSLDGIQCLASLQALFLFENTLSDLSPIKDLEQLNEVSVLWANISDITVLNGLPKLNKLGFENNQISDLSELVLPELPADLGCSFHLELPGNPITEAEVTRFCEQGWYVRWGVSGSESTPAGECNYQRLLENDCISTR